MSLHLKPSQVVEAMVSQHRHLGLDTHGDPWVQPTSDAPYDLAFACARRLGFIAADADCIAGAWARQTQRTGTFASDHWPSDPLDFVALHPTGCQPFPQVPHELGLYAVLPTADWVGRIAAAGVPTVQLRFKHSDPMRIEAEIHAAVRAVEGTPSRLFINDHWQIALQAGAYGVHLGQEDLDTLTSADLQTLKDAGLRLGLSTHGYHEMMRACAVQPSYVALGAVFPTTLKQMATPPQGLDRLGAYARLLSHLPLVAIGGISAEHLPAVASTGVGSFAVVRAITGADHPEEAAAELMQQWRELKEENPRTS